VSDRVLEVSGLSAVFATREGTAAALRDVSFSLEAGQRLAVVGESGCGKSTLALALLGLLDPPGQMIGGLIRLNGRDIANLPERQMKAIRGREISLIFQDPMGSLDPIKTIGSQLVDALRRHQPGLARRAARRRAVELLGEVEIADAERRLGDYPHHYSGGMRQRVMIAIAIANNPSVLVADEPTTALDVTVQAQILKLFERLVDRRRIALLLITHNLSLVADFCESVHVMYAGRFVECGSVDAVFNRPAHPYTEALLKSIPDPERRKGRLPTIAGLPPDLRRLPKGCAFEPRCPLGNGRQICVSVAPRRQRVGGRGEDASAECHFAAEKMTAGVVS